jgi:hypothetical protein
VEIRSRTKLVKREIKKKVPTYKWVVEYCCDNCCAETTGQGQAQVSDSAVKPVVDNQQGSAKPSVVSPSVYFEPLPKADELGMTFIERMARESQPIKPQPPAAFK